MIRQVLLAVIAASCASPVAWAAELAPSNPHLADSVYPVPHGDPAQQDALDVAGPVDVSRALKPAEIEYVHTGPAVFGAFSSGKYPDGKRVYWVNSLDRIVKIDYDTHQPLATKMLEGVPVWTEDMADESIADFDDSNTGFFAIATAFTEAQKLRDIASVYTLVDRNNEYYIAYKAGYIEVYGDAVAGDRSSDIELKRTFHYPEGFKGQVAMGLNMTYDGWVVTVTEHGKLLALKPDFSEYRLGELQHSAGAEDKATKPAGYGWVRNAPAIDDAGGVYVVSQEYMHKVVWTGDGFSTSEEDGAWAVAYDNEWGHGSGATPSLVGFGDDADRLVVITDGSVAMKLNYFWRDDIPEDFQGIPNQPRRLAGVVPVTMGNPDIEEIQSEQSVVVYGYGALVVNNAPRNRPWYVPKQAETLLVSYLGSSPEYQPFGVEKFEWDPVSNTVQPAWVNTEVSSPSSVPIVSKPNNMAYLIGARDNQWTLEALDWVTGESRFHYVIGGQRYNVIFAGTLLDDEGRIHYGGPWGRVRLNPTINRD
ncbi:MAG: hypothetical protein ABJK25_01620 [Halieaceae bacterium]